MPSIFLFQLKPFLRNSNPLKILEFLFRRDGLNLAFSLISLNKEANQMSSIETIDTNSSPKLRKPQQITNGMNFTQLFNSEILATINSRQLSDLGSPRETRSEQPDIIREPDIMRDAENRSTKREFEKVNSIHHSEKDRNFQTPKSSDVESSPAEYMNGTRDYKSEEIRVGNNNKSALGGDEQTNANTSARTDYNEPGNLQTTRNISSQTKETPTAGIEKTTNSVALDIQNITATDTADNRLILSHPHSLNFQIASDKTSTDGSKISEAVSSIIKPSLSAANKDTTVASIPNDAQVPISQKLDSSETFVSGLLPGLQQMSEQRPSNAIDQPNVNTTAGKQILDIATVSNNKTLLEPKSSVTTKLFNTDTQIKQNPIINNGSIELASLVNKAVLTENKQIKVDNVIGQSQSASLNDKNILLSSASKSLERNKPQTETRQAIDRGNISLDLKNENRMPGLKLSALEGDISVRVIDNNTAARASNAAGNNILQAQNGAQTGDNNAALLNRNGMAQPLSFSQHQVETGQSNLQTNSLKPLHVGANTGENNSNFAQNGSNGHSSNVVSNTANQPNVTPINGLESLKQHALKPDSSTNHPAATRPTGSASLSTQTNQPTAPNTLAGVNSSSPQHTNSVLAAQPTVTNSRPSAAPTPTNQVSVQLSKAIQNGDNKIKIQLRPQELGRVEVKLEIANDGRTKAMIIAERPETLDILQRDIRVLERALQDAGLKTDQNSLSFDLQSRKDNSDTQQASSQNSDEDINSDELHDPLIQENDADLISATAIGVTPDGSINLLT